MPERVTLTSGTAGWCLVTRGKGTVVLAGTIPAGEYVLSKLTGRDSMGAYRVLWAADRAAWRMPVGV